MNRVDTAASILIDPYKKQPNMSKCSSCAISIGVGILSLGTLHASAAIYRHCIAKDVGPNETHQKIGSLFKKGCGPLSPKGYNENCVTPEQQTPSSSTPSETPSETPRSDQDSFITGSLLTSQTTSKIFFPPNVIKQTPSSSTPSKTPRSDQDQPIAGFLLKTQTTPEDFSPQNVNEQVPVSATPLEDSNPSEQDQPIAEDLPKLEAAPEDFFPRNEIEQIPLSAIPSDSNPSDQDRSVAEDLPVPQTTPEDFSPLSFIVLKPYLGVSALKGSKTSLPPKTEKNVAFSDQNSTLGIDPREIESVKSPKNQTPPQAVEQPPQPLAQKKLLIKRPCTIYSFAEQIYENRNLLSRPKDGGDLLLDALDECGHKLEDILQDKGALDVLQESNKIRHILLRLVNRTLKLENLSIKQIEMWVKFRKDILSYSAIFLTLALNHSGKPNEKTIKEMFRNIYPASVNEFLGEHYVQDWLKTETGAHAKMVLTKGC